MSQKQQQFRGIIVRILPSSEADLIVAILDESGEKHVVIAKQARKSRKRFGSSLDMFDFGRFETSNGRGQLPLLNSFIPEPGFKKLRLSLSKISCASVLAEAADLLIPEGHIDHGPVTVFTIVHHGLEEINNAADTKLECRALYHSLTTLLEASGYHDQENQRAPSLHALRLVISQLEKSVERRMKSKENLELVIRA